jgi:4-carboxymuconolactone decarboxylase
VDALREGADAIGRIMGLEPEVAYETLVNSYGKDIADEVIGIGRIWNRPGLTRRERSFVAVSSLVTLGSKDRLKLHLGAALNHGMTKEEIEEAILTLMIYAGHARATEAIDIAREVFRERGLL